LRAARIETARLGGTVRQHCRCHREREAAQALAPGWKIELVEKANPKWDDLFDSLV